MNSLINQLLIFFAKKLKVSPGIVHVFIMALVMIGYYTFSPSRFNFDFELALMSGLCVVVILVTWLTKGEYSKYWWTSSFWQDEQKQSLD